jgi:hypothetical protein
MALFLILGGRVFDPSNAVDGEVRVRGFRTVESLILPWIRRFGQTGSLFSCRSP